MQKKLFQVINCRTDKMVATIAANSETEAQYILAMQWDITTHYLK